MFIIENFYKLFTNIYKIKKIINDKNKFFKLKVIFFLNFIFFFIDLFSILSLPIFVSLLVDKNYLTQKYNIGSYLFLINYDPIVIMSILIIVLFIIKNFFYIFLLNKQASFIKEIKINISEKIFSGYLLGPYTSHLNKNPSTLTRDSTYSVQSLGFYILHSINLFREIVSITFLIALLFFIKPLIMFILLIFFIPITLFFQKKFKKLLSNKANQNSKINELLTKDVFNAFLSIKDIKILEKEFDIIRKFNFKIFKYENNLYFFQVLEKIPKSILEILSIFFLLIVSLVLFQITENQVEFFTVLSLFLFATLRLLPSFTSVISSLNYLKIYEPGLVTLYNQNNQSFKLNHIPNKDFSKFCNKKTVSKKLIIVEKLNFSYQKNKYFLKDINLEISEGKMHCITGETGSGKSTILNLMLGLLEPLSGNIYYKDKNIKSDISNWHQALSFVSQDPYLFDDSILNNISFNVLKNNIDKKKLNKAIEISELKQTIAKFPKGLNAKVSTQSINLSGGEKQRIALARAIYKDCNIFFLDEFTNAIDNETEKKIMQNLRNLKNKTFIIISHKKSTIDQCDKIWKLENGKIY